MANDQVQSFTGARPRLTVAAIAERNGRFLVVEERTATGALVINQPAGHVEHGETLLEAVSREAFEETAWRFTPELLVGVYLWKHPGGQSSYVRVSFAGAVDEHDPESPLDEGIERALWLSRDELAAQAERLRSPMVLRTIDDYLAGERYPLTVLKSLLS
ncbi:MAG TPA: NUDIX hydrolase [Methylococcaceae bacterium]|jgi:ADP-ribose pyrophosphatase YjhB (NUDIX family)|nr:NUDIX hydrolase [Methylococcaceae bacterium]